MKGKREKKGERKKEKNEEGESWYPAAAYERILFICVHACARMRTSNKQ